MTDEPDADRPVEGAARPSVIPPALGLIAMRIGLEFGPPEEFGRRVDRALARGGERGATVVAQLDTGELAIRIPREDGPSWNTVPLLHLYRGRQPTVDEWATANAVLEKLERYR
jgi:hypothetical protein